jgi:transcriptional regulator with XRE-family HTH domain
MAYHAGENAGVLLIRARQALGMTQEEFGTALGVSKRTAQRWDASQAFPSPQELHKLARLIYPTDRSLAAQIAKETGETLESLGIAAAVPPPAPPPRALPPTHLMVESVVCAAAEALETKPAAARDALRAAFGRARAMGLTVDEIDDALSPKAARVAEATEAASVKRRTRS